MATKTKQGRLVVRDGRLLRFKPELSDEYIQLKVTEWREQGHDVQLPKGNQPGLATMERWMDDGVAKATDGCRVEPDGVCPHGHKSWMVVLGFI